MREIEEKWRRSRVSINSGYPNLLDQDRQKP
jgi:hypothetical protein